MSRINSVKRLRLIELLERHGLGDRVGLRSEGQMVRPEITENIRSLGEGEILGIDLERVKTLSYSFADEVIVVPLTRLVSGEYGNKYLVVIAENAEVCEDLDRALQKRGLPLIRLRDNIGEQWFLMGSLSNQLRATLGVIAEVGPISTGRLHERFGTSIQNISNRVVGLGEYRLIRRVQVSVERGGVQYENALAVK